MNQVRARAWTGSKMEYDILVGRFGTFYVNPGPNDDGLDENDSASLTPLTTKLSDDAPVMLSTCHKDKNDVEVYAGDIFDSEAYPFVSEGLRNYRGIILWDETEKLFWYDVTAISDRVRGGAVGESFGELPGDAVVIGNIYENPDLVPEWTVNF